MKKILLLPLLLACTTLSPKTTTTNNEELQIFSAAFHKSYQYYIVANNCRDVEENEALDCQLAIRLHHFIDSPIYHSFESLFPDYDYIFYYNLEKTQKPIVKANQLKIKDITFHFEEKIVEDKYYLWLRINHISDDIPTTSDLVIDLTDAMTPRAIYAENNSDLSAEEAWAEILKSLN